MGPTEIANLHKYVLTWRYDNGALITGTNKDPKPLPHWDNGRLLKVYELQVDGSLVEYKEPQRLFALKNFSTTSMPGPANCFAWKNYSEYYEVMPNGDYIKLTDEQVEELREAQS